MKATGFVAALVTAVLGAVATAGISPAEAGTLPPVALAAPYEYLGWGNPQPPAGVLGATGIHDLTLAFVLAHKGCHPAWDGTRPLSGGSDAAAIASIRSAGGDVDVSVGGWSGTKLGNACKTVAALTAAYQEVVSTYGLSALDVDIEHTEYTKAASRQRVIEALAALQQADPTLEISVTFGTTETGPDADGSSMIQQAASLGFRPYAWTIMPFDFGAPVSDMGTVSIQAAEGLAADVAAAYGETTAQAYAEIGISSMNAAPTSPTRSCPSPISNRSSRSPSPSTWPACPSGRSTGTASARPARPGPRPAAVGSPRPPTPSPTSWPSTADSTLDARPATGDLARDPSTIMSDVRFGLHALGIGPGADPDVIVAVSRAAEACGFARLWCGEHVVMTEGADRPYPYSPDGRIAVPADAPWLDPFVALTFAAAATDRIRLATGILLLPEHQPLVVAKQAASLDVLSRGRLDLGVGIGWSAAEFEALGVPFAGRAARTVEYVEALRVLWRDDVATFTGDHVRFEAVRSHPKPLAGRVPILLGGNSDTALGRVARIGDGWYGFNLSAAEAAERMATLARLCGDAGRSRAALDVAVALRDGSPDEVGALRDAGVDEVVVVGSPPATATAASAWVRDLASTWGVGNGSS